MKDWQKGYELDELIEIQDKSFATYNKQVLNPFLVMKKNRVADALSKDELLLTENGGIHCMKLKAGGKISMFTGYKIPILQKKAGDVIVKRLSPADNDSENKQLERLLEGLCEKSSVYVFIIDECIKSHEIAKNVGFKVVGRQYNTFADAITIYYKGEKRDRIKVEPAEYLTLIPLNHKSTKGILGYINAIQYTLRKLEDNKVIDFTNHYSNYNQAKSWSAISLRGYTDDWRFIEKPEEMNKKWKKENEGKDFFLQDTTLMKNFCRDGVNFVYELLDCIGIDTKPHRIRLMKLSAGQGTLERHTDQVCPDTGVADGKLMRLHFPIITNDKVKFKSWWSKDYDEINMQEGECWYLDTRKPHEAINGGDTDRVHLVIDVPASPQIRKLVIS